MTDLYALAVQLGKATHYIEIFPDQNTINADYRRLATGLHPDKYLDDDKGVATEAFHMLNVFKAEASQMAQEGRYGERKVLATIKTRKATHKVIRRIGEDSMAVYYRATSTPNGPTMIKVAKSPRDNDLMAQEVKALKLLHKPDDALTRHYPNLYDSFMYPEGRRRAVVTPLYEHFHSLETIHKRFPQGLDPGHGVWMFRRLLMALGFAHEQGLVHGAVTPDNVLIGAADHAVVLIDWCYSVVIDAQSKTNFIKAVVPMYQQFYPEEVLAKDTPSAATDLYMAAYLMNYLMPVAPKPIRAFFKGTTLTKQSMRPQNAWGLLKEFDEMLEAIGEPFHPRRWVEFAVPAGSA